MWLLITVSNLTAILRKELKEKQDVLKGLEQELEETKRDEKDKSERKANERVWKKGWDFLRSSERYSVYSAAHPTESPEVSRIIYEYGPNALFYIVRDGLFFPFVDVTLTVTLYSLSPPVADVFGVGMVVVCVVFGTIVRRTLMHFALVDSTNPQ
jgi:hypothetical protein